MTASSQTVVEATEPSAESVLAAVVSMPPVWSDTARDLGRQAVEDTLAIAVAAREEDQVRIARSSLGLPAVAPPDVLLTEPGLRPTEAAYITAVMAHALDWDDYMHPMHGHCSSVLLGATWPLVAASGGGPEELLDAFLVGYHVDHLVSLVLSHGHYYAGWHATSTVGAVGAAAAAARLLRLDGAAAGHALGIAASGAAGLRANFGTTTKALHAGNAARAGVHAALLAQAGATSSPSWLLGARGMASLMSADHPGADGRRKIAEAATGPHGIETEWGLAQKPYSCCGSCHAAIDALLHLAIEQDIEPDAIDAIELHLDPVVPTVMPEPVASDPHAARYCLPWVAAAAATDRALGPAQFTSDALGRADIRELVEKVAIVPDLATTPMDRYAGRVVVRTSRGTVEHTVRHALGHPANPMGRERRRAKIEEALGFAFEPDRVGDLAGLIAGLVDVEVIPH